MKKHIKITNEDEVLGYCKLFKEKLRESKSFENLLNLHKQMYKIGFKASVLGVCPWGHFRTDSIENLKLKNAYFGDIYGLWTKPLSYWEQCSEEIGENLWGLNPKTPIKSIIFDQYKDVLDRGITYSRDELLYELKEKKQHIDRIKMWAAIGIVAIITGIIIYLFITA